MPDNDYVTRQEFNDAKNELLTDIRDNRTNIQANAENITELRAMYKSLADLPGTINSLDKTIVKICDRLDNMDENLKSMNELTQKAIDDMNERNKQQDEKINRVDSKSKVDWATFITENFWKVILAVGVIYYVVKDMIH